MTDAERASQTSQAYWFLRQLRNRARKDGKAKWQLWRVTNLIHKMQERIRDEYYEAA